MGGGRLKFSSSENYVYTNSALGRSEFVGDSRRRICLEEQIADHATIQPYSLIWKHYKYQTFVYPYDVSQILV
jgi:hypothetical protein